MRYNGRACVVFLRGCCLRLGVAASAGAGRRAGVYVRFTFVCVRVRAVNSPPRDAW